MSGKKIDELYQEYTKERFLKLSKEQFHTILLIFPALLVVLSDGIVERDEWIAVKKLAKILGVEFASEDFGEEKEENLTLLYKAEFRYLLKKRALWEARFLEALKEHISKDDSSKEFVLETMYLFANSSGNISTYEDNTIQFLINELKLEE